MKRINIYTLTLLALLLGLVACTQKELADSLLLEGAEGTPIVFTATGLNLTATTATTGTRATVYDNWENVSSVAVMIDGTVKEYSVAATDTDNYKTATLSSDDPHYWSTGHDPLVVTAWCPYSADETEPPVVVVNENQSTQDGFEGSDFISAEEQTVTYNSSTLSFTHRTARVTIKLQAGEGITSVYGATVLLTSLSETNDNPPTITSYNSGDNTYEALLAPQRVAAGNSFIEVELNGGTFTFTPQGDIVLDAGNRYTYTVNVNATGLTLEGSTISAWTEGEGEDGAGEIVDYTYDEYTNTYTVYTPKGLFVWNEAAQDYLSTNCTLANDIDWTGIEWTPVGDEYNPYTGTFEGGGFTITGLTIDQSSSYCVGLIGHLGFSGKVQNLTLDNVDITGYCSVGGVVGVNYGNVTACNASGRVSGTDFVGGVVGSNNYLGTVTACYSSGSVTGTSSVGGVVGTNDRGSTVTACSSTGSVTGTSYVGGVVGWNNTGGTVTACYHATGSVSGSDEYVGGVVGNSSGTVTDCYWSDYNGNGIGMNNGSGTATKVEYDVTWDVAVGYMNDAIDKWNEDNSANPEKQCEWQYEYHGEDTPPTLKKSSSSQ